jgi:hypothetical protein
VTAASELDLFLSELTPEDHSVIRLLDSQRVGVEQSDLDSEPVYGVISCLRMWQFVISLMEQGWGDGRWMVYEYLNYLTVRDRVEDTLDAMPEGLREKVRPVVARLDGRYERVTVEDGGAELGQYWRPLSEGRETRWWWIRNPHTLPSGW